MRILGKSADPMGDRHMALPIAREGYPFIIPMAMASLLFGLMGWVYLAGIFCGITFFAIYFFRNPTRIPPSSKSAIVSPADGTVLEVESYHEDRFLQRESTKISIFMSLFDVHVNRSPITGRVIKRVYRPGKFFAANTDKSSLLNEQNALLLSARDGFKVLFIQIAGIIARRIICNVQKGDLLKKGQIFGMIRFGSRMDVFLPPNVDIQVRLGDHVKGGETILGYRNAKKTKDRN
ncbi:MAG: phosphatidylserine decarboxylase family protein [Syntrophobacterales bacterium]|nr:MAG: phosphatidylserine decarboxylase family protein [Syntrophobacterales bacterium]